MTQNVNDGWRSYDVGNVRHFVRFDSSQRHTVTVDDGQRQMIIMALADLSMKHPGFDYACNEIACLIDNVVDGRARMYDDFRALRKPIDEARRLLCRAALLINSSEIDDGILAKIAELVGPWETVCEIGGRA